MADYLGVVTELRVRQKALAAEIAELGAIITGLERLATTGTSERAEPSIVSFGGKTLPQAVRIYMESVARPQTTRQVVNSLKAGGVSDAAKSFVNQVYNALHRGSKPGGDYVRDGDKWRLRA